MIDLLAKGLLIGVSVAAPVGPISLLGIRRSLQEGYKSGLATALGAVSADGIYGSVAGLGLTFISNYLISHQDWIRLLGGVFLVYLGIKILFSQPADKTVANSEKSNLLNVYLSTLFLTLTNPLTIISFVAIFGELGLGNTQGGYLNACALVLGIVLGALAWWLTMVTSVAIIFRTRISDLALCWINRVSGCLIAGFGLSAFVGLI